MGENCLEKGRLTRRGHPCLTSVCGSVFTVAVPLVKLHGYRNAQSFQDQNNGGCVKKKIRPWIRCTDGDGVKGKKIHFFITDYLSDPQLRASLTGAPGKHEPSPPDLDSFLGPCRAESPVADQFG